MDSEEYPLTIRYALQAAPDPERYSRLWTFLERVHSSHSDPFVVSLEFRFCVFPSGTSLLLVKSITSPLGHRRHRRLC